MRISPKKPQKREAEGKDDAFDERVFGAIRSQAADKGIDY